jgi:hypothetical protein
VGRVVKKDTTPTTKECAFCLETIPIKATKCKACASPVAATAAATAAAT